MVMGCFIADYHEKRIAFVTLQQYGNNLKNFEKRLEQTEGAELLLACEP
jgi:hypothetical protein